MGVVVREWVTLPVHHEFRAFVHDGALKAMSQYNHPCYYPRMTEQVWMFGLLRIAFGGRLGRR